MVNNNTTISFKLSLDLMVMLAIGVLACMAY